jgi:hypothetical protein
LGVVRRDEGGERRRVRVAHGGAVAQPGSWFAHAVAIVIPTRYGTGHAARQTPGALQLPQLLDAGRRALDDLLRGAAAVDVGGVDQDAPASAEALTCAWSVASSLWLPNVTVPLARLATA